VAGNIVPGLVRQGLGGLVAGEVLINSNHSPNRIPIAV
jgi:hypothetical protein